MKVKDDLRCLEKKIFTELGIPNSYFKEKSSSVSSAEMNKEFIEKKWKAIHGLDLNQIKGGIYNEMYL
jgi:hypothetical protein